MKGLTGFAIGWIKRFPHGYEAFGSNLISSQFGRLKMEKNSLKMTNKVGKITRAQAEEIAKTKMPDLTAADMDAAVRTIAGSARSMGIEVEGV